MLLYCLVACSNTVYWIIHNFFGSLPIFSISRHVSKYGFARNAYNSHLPNISKSPFYISSSFTLSVWELVLTKLTTESTYGVHSCIINWGLFLLSLYYVMMMSYFPLQFERVQPNHDFKFWFTALLFLFCQYFFRSNPIILSESCIGSFYMTNCP